MNTTLQKKKYKRYKYDLLENGFSNKDISIAKKVLSTKKITIGENTNEFEKILQKA